VGNAANDYGEFLTSSLTLQDRIKTSEGVINAALSGQPRSRKIYIAWDEWNVWYRARGDTQRGRRILEERYNLEDALVVATFLNTFVNNAHILKMANMAQLVNVIAPIFTDEKRMFLHRNEAVETDVELEDRQFAGTVEISEVNAADVKTENSFEATNVKTLRRSVKAEKGLLRYSFPAHSYTMLKAKLA
jgi:alpha-L-arabinofuranosidase